MSDADSTDEFEPVQVFETTDMDLRPGSDDCYKCSTCDTSCPVAEVDDDFPGPKFQGPEQWRLKRKEGHTVDDSITGCSNCMRCDNACPSSVPLSQMHNTARGEYVEEQRFGREALAALRLGDPREALEIVDEGRSGLVERARNRILANYRTSAWFASKVPRLANRAMNFGPARWLMEVTLGVTKEREFPAFAEQTFREWWAERGGARVKNAEKRVAYFHGCYSNFNTTEVGKAMVRVYEEFGYEVLVPPQQCSGTPMFANGMLGDARRHAETNVENLAAAIDDGADVIASCTSCSMALRQEYPELFDLEGIESVAANTYEALEYPVFTRTSKEPSPRPRSTPASSPTTRRVTPGTRGSTARRSNCSPTSTARRSRTSATRVRESRARTAGRRRSTTTRWQSARRCSNTWKAPTARPG